VASGDWFRASNFDNIIFQSPLATEFRVQDTRLLDAEFSGQWGLEDYVVEVAGSECLHFMEVDGLLRDGDEVVYLVATTQSSGPEIC
jgi:hypothetical protein